MNTKNLTLRFFIVTCFILLTLFTFSLAGCSKSDNAITPAVIPPDPEPTPEPPAPIPDPPKPRSEETIADGTMLQEVADYIKTQYNEPTQKAQKAALRNLGRNIWVAYTITQNNIMGQSIIDAEIAQIKAMKCLSKLGEDVGPDSPAWVVMTLSSITPQREALMNAYFAELAKTNFKPVTGEAEEKVEELCGFLLENPPVYPEVQP